MFSSARPLSSSSISVNCENTSARCPSATRSFTSSWNRSSLAEGGSSVPGGSLSNRGSQHTCRSRISAARMDTRLRLKPTFSMVS